MNEVMVTLPTETQRYVSHDTLTGQPMVNPADLTK